jgi:hypothetical protein
MSQNGFEMYRVKKITITSRRDRLWLVSRPVSYGPLCSQCPSGPMITAGAAAALTKKSLRAICREVDAGLVHYYDGPEGLYICLTSLAVE